MNGRGHSMLVLFPHQFISPQEEEKFHELLLQISTDEQFCRAHELVDRNYITSSSKKILKETRTATLRPFRFLINKN